MKIAMLGVKAVPCPGGIAAYAQQLSSSLVQRGHEVTIYCRRQYLDGDAYSTPLPPYNGIERKLTPGLRGKYLDALTHTFTSALDSLRQDYDVVHIHGSAPAVVAPLLRLRLGRPSIVTIHSLDWQGGKWGPLATTAMRSGASIPLHFAHEVTVVSKSLQQFYHDVFRRDTTYIPTGVELPDILPAQEIKQRWGLSRGEYILFVGRLTPEKGLEYLLPAYKAIDTDKKLVIVGGTNFKDPYVENLKKYASLDIVFTGYLQGPILAELFSNAHLYVQPSTLEGMPVAVLEALSYGRCVLASGIPGNREALGECGYTFQAGNVDDLREKLAMLLHNPQLVVAQYGIARDHIRRQHNWGKTADEFEKLYNRLVSKTTQDLPLEKAVAANASLRIDQSH